MEHESETLAAALGAVFLVSEAISRRPGQCQQVVIKLTGYNALRVCAVAVARIRNRTHEAQEQGEGGICPGIAAGVKIFHEWISLVECRETVLRKRGSRGFGTSRAIRAPHECGARCASVVATTRGPVGQCAERATNQRSHPKD